MHAYRTKMTKGNENDGNERFLVEAYFFNVDRNCGR